MGTAARDAWQRPAPPPWLEEVTRAGGGELAMDSAGFDVMQDYALASSPWSEGLGFMGYAYLAELAQRPEYRRISEIWAAECTRRWIKLTGGTPDRLAKLDESMKHFGVREKFREAIEIDGGMGRAHIFMDFGDKEAELALPVKHEPEVITPDSLKNLKVVEPFWAYPLDYNTNSPISDAFYAPQAWQIYSDKIDNSRMLTFVGREVPDILKPVYMFGGLSLSQMVKPAVDNYIRNRTSVGNLLFSFSTMVLATEMGVMFTEEGAGALRDRISAFVYGRDNGGLMLVDKETEELSNVAAPLSTTDALLSQSLEQILIPAGIPMVIYAGTTPHGLNASSDGEIDAFHGHIMGYNEKTCTGPLMSLLRVLQLNLDGVIDDTVGFEWLPLRQPTAMEDAERRAKEAETDNGYLDRGVLNPEDVRDRLKGDEGGPYFGIELEGNEDAEPGADGGDNPVSLRDE
jgi:phage-related protein (TIGR01555 family)